VSVSWIPRKPGHTCQPSDRAVGAHDPSLKGPLFIESKYSPWHRRPRRDDDGRRVLRLPNWRGATAWERAPFPDSRSKLHPCDIPETQHSGIPPFALRAPEMQGLARIRFHQVAEPHPIAERRRGDLTAAIKHVITAIAAAVHVLQTPVLDPAEAACRHPSFRKGCRTT
jgi:hypothetical protein